MRDSIFILCVRLEWILLRLSQWGCVSCTEVSFAPITPRAVADIGLRVRFLPLLSSKPTAPPGMEIEPSVEAQNPMLT